MTAVEFARRLDIDSNRLSSYEHGRVPIRYELAIKVCREFNISQRWLARGILPMQPKYDVPMEYSYLVKPNSLFSKVFDGWLDAPTQRIEQALIEMVGEENFRAGKFDDAVFSNFPPADSTPPQAMAFYVKKLISLRLNWLPQDLQLMYGKALLQADKSFQTKYAKRMEKLVPPAARKYLDQSAQVEKIDLTNPATSIKHLKVKPHLPSLLERLNLATKETGKMSALAVFLAVQTKRKVPLASVSRWLSGKREPGGEITLLMQHWVEQQERQK